MEGVVEDGHVRVLSGDLLREDNGLGALKGEEHAQVEEGLLVLIPSLAAVGELVGKGEGGRVSAARRAEGGGGNAHLNKDDLAGAVLLVSEELEALLVLAGLV